MRQAAHLASTAAPAPSADVIDWLRLVRSDRIGPVTFFGLLTRFGSAAAAVEALPGLNARAGRAGGLVATRAMAEDELAATVSAGGTILTAGDPRFSPLLGAVTPPPPLISVRGELALLHRPTVGMVGARNASAAGLKMARVLAAGLGQAGLVVASGLARGIDGAAHEASLATGTIAVLAGGIDHVYPTEHASLHARIAEQGLLVSESAYGHSVQARDFPRRNRIISGLSSATIVVEAEARSGSLITARMANEQGRDVLAVPGSPLDPRAAGPNSLIREGATLVTCVDDVLEAIRRPDLLSEPDRNRRFDGLQGPVEPGAALIDSVAALLSPAPVSLDELADDSGLPWRTVAAILIELELSGRAVLKPGGGVASV
jgi:DNA processing protein